MNSSARASAIASGSGAVAVHGQAAGVDGERGRVLLGQQRDQLVLAQAVGVREHGRGEQVEEAVRAVGADRVVQAGRRLERARRRRGRRPRTRPPPSTGRHASRRRSGSSRPRRASRTAATSPRSPRPGASSQNERTPSPSFASHQRLRVRDPFRVDRASTSSTTRPVSRASWTRSRSPSPPSSTTLSRGASRGSSSSSRRRADEAVEDPRVLGRARRAVGLDRLRHVHRRGREQRRVVDQTAQQYASGVAAHAGGIALRFAGHSRTLPA